MIRKLLSLIAAVTSIHAAPALAGSSEGGKAHLPEAEVASFSNRVQLDLAARGAGIAIVARTGRPPKSLPKGVSYTHTAFWVFSNIRQPDGSTAQGYRVYNLYQKKDDLTRSALVQESPMEFFRGAHALDAGIIIPTPQLQRKLLRVVSGNAYAALHNPTYSVLANPNTTRFQNCTEHTLDVLMAGLHGTNEQNAIKSRIAADFQAQPIKISGLKRFLAPAASAALTTSDHGDTIATATFSSIARYMRDNNLASEVYRLTPDHALRF